jgi:hypothetical protein
VLSELLCWMGCCCAWLRDKRVETQAMVFGDRMNGLLQLQPCYKSCKMTLDAKDGETGPKMGP